MKNSAEYARRIRRLIASLKGGADKSDPPALDSITHHLIFAILMRHGSDAEAMSAYRCLQLATVDLNELRVTPADEITELIGGVYSNARAAAEGVARALAGLFNRSHNLDLDFLTQLPRKEARAWLQSLDGMDTFSSAVVQLRCLNEPAFPVDEPVLALLKAKDAVPDAAAAADAESLLDRVVPTSQTEQVLALLRSHARGKASRRSSQPKQPAARADKRSARSNQPSTRAKQSSTTAKQSSPKATQPSTKATQPSVKSKKRSDKTTAPQAKHSSPKPAASAKPKSAARPKSTARAKSSAPASPRPRAIPNPRAKPPARRRSAK